MTGFADDPDEIRRQFPDLATLAAAVPMGAFLDGMAAGREHMASYKTLRPEPGQTVVQLVAEVVDEVMEAIYCRVLAAYTAEATQ